MLREGKRRTICVGNSVSATRVDHSLLVRNNVSSFARALKLTLSRRNLRLIVIGLSVNEEQFLQTIR